VLNIDGEDIQWNVFKKRFLDSMPKDRNEAEFILNLG